MPETNAKDIANIDNGKAKARDTSQSESYSTAPQSKYEDEGESKEKFKTIG